MAQSRHFELSILQKSCLSRHVYADADAEQLSFRLNHSHGAAEKTLEDHFRVSLVKFGGR